MKHLLTLFLLAGVLLLQAGTKILYPSKADWRSDGKAEKDGVMRLVNTSDKDNHSMRLWMKTYQGQKLTFKVVLSGENIAAKKRPYQGVRFFLWGRVGGKSTEFGKNLDLKGTFSVSQSAIPIRSSSIRCFKNGRNCGPLFPPKRKRRESGKRMRSMPF